MRILRWQKLMIYTGQGLFGNFMLKKRNTSVHIYNAEEVDELILLIRDSFIPAFTALKDTLVKKLDEAESKWEKNL